MTFQLDTTGRVEFSPWFVSKSGAHLAELLWDDLSPFTQGYIEALFASAVDPRGRTMMPRDGRYASAPRERRKVAFRDLAPEALARIIADCSRYRNVTTQAGGEKAGRRFWKDRQKGMSGVFGAAFPPLTVYLGDDGKVRFAA